MHVSPKKKIFFLVPFENDLEGELTNLRGRFFFCILHVISQELIILCSVS